MASTIIKIAEQKVNGDWCNIKTTEGQELSINLKSNPKSAAFINAGAKEFTVNLVDKGGKLYGWDISEQTKKSSPFQKLSPEEIKAKQDREDHTQRMIVAQSCYAATCNLKQQSNTTHADVLKMTETAYHFIMELSK